MINKVLFISPTPTHPTNAGNRVHIKSLVSFFKENNWEAHFLYLAYENYDEQAMLSYFGDNLVIIPKEIIYQSSRTLPYILRRLSAIVIQFKRQIELFSKVITKDQYLYNTEVDHHFSVFVKPAIRKLQEENTYEIVVCEYASMSKAFTYFDKSVYKIIDVHDKFTDRYIAYLKNNLKPDWVSLHKDQERKALRRADLIIALQETERRYFESLSGKKAICFLRFPAVDPLPAKRFEKKLLYFASANIINMKALEYFEDEILPLLKQRQPDVQLLVGGSICQAYRKKDTTTLQLGLFDTPAEFYKLGDIVVNPELEGTGFKIKTVEALCYGMPVVCTKAGAVGLTDTINEHLIIADTPLDFSKALIEMIENNSLRIQTGLKAKEWIRLNKERMSKDLTDNVAMHSNSV